MFYNENSCNDWKQKYGREWTDHKTELDMKKGGIVWWWGVPLPSLIIKLWTFLYWKTSFVFITLCFSNDERWDYLNEELYFEGEIYKPPKLFYQFGGRFFNFIFLNQPTGYLSNKPVWSILHFFLLNRYIDTINWNVRWRDVPFLYYNEIEICLWVVWTVSGFISFSSGFLWHLLPFN